MHADHSTAVFDHSIFCEARQVQKRSVDQIGLTTQNKIRKNFAGCALDDASIVQCRWRGS